MRWAIYVVGEITSETGDVVLVQPRRGGALREAYAALSVIQIGQVSTSADSARCDMLLKKKA